MSSQSTRSASRSSASTRSVTSSRLPIGVAQTASGTVQPPLPGSVECLEADERGSDEPGLSAELGGQHTKRLVGG